jgi:phosphate transport system protein
MLEQHILDLKEKQIRANLQELFKLSRNAIEQSVDCLKTANHEQAAEILASDNRLNEMRRLLEQDCLIAIASQQPVARDLREIVAAMRIAGELERMGDYASDIAAVVQRIDDQGLDELGLEQVLAMSTICLAMLDEIRRAYLEQDALLALDTSQQDHRVDAVLERLIRQCSDRMQAAPDLINNGSRLLWAAHSLERCGNHIANIAEQVVFMGNMGLE